MLVLGENKIHFIPGMIGPFLGVTLVPQVEVRNIMIPIFHDMMDWEQRKNGNFKQVHTHTDTDFYSLNPSHAETESALITHEAVHLSVCVCVFAGGG